MNFFLRITYNLHTVNLSCSKILLILSTRQGSVQSHLGLEEINISISTDMVDLHPHHAMLLNNPSTTGHCVLAWSTLYGPGHRAAADIEHLYQFFSQALLQLYIVQISCKSTVLQCEEILIQNIYINFSHKPYYYSQTQFRYNLKAQYYSVKRY